VELLAQHDAERHADQRPADQRGDREHQPEPDVLEDRHQEEVDRLAGRVGHGDAQPDGDEPSDRRRERLARDQPQDQRRQRHSEGGQRRRRQGMRGDVDTAEDHHRQHGLDHAAHAADGLLEGELLGNRRRQTPAAGLRHATSLIRGSSGRARSGD
jgi:hypothetical protein